MSWAPEPESILNTQKSVLVMMALCSTLFGVLVPLETETSIHIKITTLILTWHMEFLNPEYDSGCRVLLLQLQPNMHHPIPGTLIRWVLMCPIVPVKAFHIVPCLELLGCCKWTPLMLGWLSHSC